MGLVILKYFSAVSEKPVNTGGKKLIADMQEIINRFLKNENVLYKEYSYGNLRNIIHLILPCPYASYLFFGYLGNPFFATPQVIFYAFFFVFVAFKKKIAKEHYTLLVPDLFELQSTVAKNKQNWSKRFFIIFQCVLERILLGYVADTIITSCPEEYLSEKFPKKKIISIEFIDQLTDLKINSNSNSNSQKIHLMYCGDFGGRNGISKTLLKKILANLASCADFWMVATGVDKDLIQDLKRFDNFHFLGQKEISELNFLAKKCDFGFILYSSEMQYYNIMPSLKLSFYISNGLTVISSNLLRTRQLNDVYDFGYVLSEEEMLRFIRTLSKEKAKRNQRLEIQISRGQFLYDALVKSNLKI